MKEIRSPQQISKEILRWQQKGKKVGFVPTMGALHQGHLALVQAARKENDIVVVSIFVNPTQFGPREDFSKYPRPEALDRALLRHAKVDYLFSPSVSGMYPQGFAAEVEITDHELTDRLCGKLRPGHFKGVATVVAKLFNSIHPDAVYFGAKDYQQSVIVEKMIQDLNFGISFRRMPTVRERDGLAMSSRNRYLSPAERKQAGQFPRILFWLKEQLQLSRKSMQPLCRQALSALRRAVDRVDYLEVVDPVSLQPLRNRQAKMVIIAACYVGKTRLIDNVIMHFKKTRS